ncbi:MAG TPA: o-succinylbenzoate synthase [Planctomycetota bacterium]|nr:o-succinylbenzoate synthase [Planctomycetota bacterium]
MRIDAVEIHHLRLPLRDGFEISSGRLTAISTILVRLRSGEHEGWGEAPPWDEPIYGAETAETAFHVLRDVIAPRVIGRSFATPEELAALLASWRGNNFAKAALETAWWVLRARMLGVPLHRLLGGDGTKPIDCGVSLGIEATHDLLLDNVARSLDEGYQRVKVKVKHGWDVDVLAKIRRKHPDIALQVDANSHYTLADVDHLRRFDDFGLVQIEQPLAWDDLVDHAELQRRIRTPICLDESIHSVDDARKAIALGSCRMINIKLTRVGGLHEAKLIHDLCARHDVPCWVGGMLESAIGEAICMEFATLPNIRMPSDIFPSAHFYDDDTTSPLPTMSARGTFMPSTRPGIAYDPDWTAIARLTVKSWSVVAARAG